METIYNNLVQLLTYDPQSPIIFSSGLFLVLFVGFTLVYYLLHNTFTPRILFVTLFSYYFYYKSSGIYFILLAVVTMSDYLIAKAIHNSREENADDLSYGRGYRKMLVLLSLAIDLGFLGYFKYANFFGANFALIVGQNFQPWDIFLPVGISFFTFKLISYTIEVRRGNIQPERNFINFGTYVAFFPTIMSGPIDRPKPFLDQLRHNHLANSTDLSEGAKRVLWGFFLKMCIANRICIYTDSVFNHCFFHNGTTLIVASVLYLIQMYTDFSGYSHMAVGVSRMMGIRVMENFQQPFFAQNVADFWRRWHISLSSWLRDYIYIPMGGSRCSEWRCHYNNLVTFVVCGIWHGANWTYVLFGTWHGLMVIIDRAVKPLRERLENRHALKGKRLYKLTRQSITFVLCAFGAMLFRANSFTDIVTIITNIGNGFGPLFTAGTTLMFTVGLFAFVVMLYKEYRDEYGGKALFMYSPNRAVRIGSITLAILYIAATGELENISFIYFQF